MRMIDGDELVMWLSKWMISSFGTEPTEETEAIRKVCDAVGDMVTDLAKDTGGDLVSRQAAIDVAVQSLVDWDGMFIQDANCRIMDAINELPSAEPERKTGWWIPQDNNKISWTASTAVYYYPECSVCGCWADYTNFCPNCGAKMLGEDGEKE